MTDAINSAAPELECDHPPGQVTPPCVSACATAGLAGEDAVNDPGLSPALPPTDSIVRFPEPIPAIWSNKDFDKPVTLVAKMTSPGFPDHYLTADHTGIPVA